MPPNIMVIFVRVIMIFCTIPTYSLVDHADNSALVNMVVTFQSFLSSRVSFQKDFTTWLQEIESASFHPTTESISFDFLLFGSTYFIAKDILT